MNETEKKLLGELARDMYKAKETLFAKLYTFGEVMKSKNKTVPYDEQQVDNLFIGISRIIMSAEKMTDTL